MSLKDFVFKCHTNLVHNKHDREVKIAREYLNSRNLLEKSIISTRIGYCNSDFVLPDLVRFFGAEYRKDEDDKKWDMSFFIGGKIIVPVFSEFNTIAGLATRKPTKEPGNTWWNLPFPFRKGSHLFLLNENKKSIFEKNKIYLVEGYMDALILKQYGLNNVVGLMGTALTSRKIGLIARYCNNVCICFDTDENSAGQNARDMSIFILKKFDFCDSISTINLPIKEDPDEFVSKNGMEKLLEQEVVLKDSEIEKTCRKIVRQKNSKEIAYAQ